MTAEDMFEYQRVVWSRPEVQGFDELVDMTRVTDLPSPTPASIRSLAARSAAMDQPEGRSRFAIVAPDDLVYGLGRMYQTHRGLATGSKEVAVFRTVEAGLAWLGRMTPGPDPPDRTPRDQRGPRCFFRRVPLQLATTVRMLGA